MRLINKMTLYLLFNITVMLFSTAIYFYVLATIPNPFKICFIIIWILVIAGFSYNMLLHTTNKIAIDFYKVLI